MSENPEEQPEQPAELELHLGEESIPPTDPKAQRLRYWANIIATTAALLTAVAAIFKPQDQTVNRNTYEQLKISIEQTNASVKQDHEDMVALHNYLQGYFAGNNTFSPPTLIPSSLPSSTPSPSPSPKPSVIPHKMPTITFGIPSTSSAIEYAYAAPAAPAPAFPLPPVSTVSAAIPLPAFDSVAAKK